MTPQNFELNPGKSQKNKYRRFISQLIAASAKNILTFSSGLVVALPTIVIAALTSIRNEHNQDELLTITGLQASWLGSFGYMLTLLGSLLTGIVTDPLGRKRSMMVVNILFLIGWLTLYRSTSVWEVSVGYAFLGFSVGIVEAPLANYMGEICEPSFRGTLLGIASLYSSLGMFMIFLLNTLMAWRTVCLVCSVVPIIAAIAISFIPESPRWLISKNRKADAEKALCWLRGWAPKEFVAQELDDLRQHSDRSKSCNTCLEQDLKCDHTLPSLTDKLAEFKRKKTLKPLFIIISLFFLGQFASITSMKPFMVQIFRAYNSPIPPDHAVKIMSFLELTATVTLILLVRFTGKRRILLFCMLILLVCAGTVTCYGFIYLPSGFISFNQANREPYKVDNEWLGYIPFACLLTSGYFTFSIIRIPWMLISEIFPFKSRGMASGLAAATFFGFAMIGSKTYYDLETTLSLPGVSLMYTCICFMGLILMYNILPETENRTLEDIELHFSDNSKGITDRNIVITK